MSVPVCVYCRQHPVVPESAPFCSPRCRQADLGRWLRGDYRVPGPPAESALDPSEGDGIDVRPFDS